MKRLKRYTFLSLLLTFTVWPALTFSQVNEYLNHNPVWLVEKQYTQNIPCIQTEYINYITAGDTVLGGLTYKKILREGTGHYDWMAPPPVNPNCTGAPYTFIETVSNLFMRSDNKKMFFRTSLDTIENLLYDFDLQIGDTLPQTYNNFNQNGATVAAIDSIYTPYGYRKRFEIANGFPPVFYLLEGIGSTHGFLEYYNYDLNIEGAALQCFSLEDTIYYSWFPGTSCNLNVGLQDDIIFTREATVFPNPFSETATITWSVAISKGELIIYTPGGKIARRNSNINGTSVSVEKENLSPGMYFFDIKDELSSGLLKGKLLVR